MDHLPRKAQALHLGLGILLIDGVGTLSELVLVVDSRQGTRSQAGKPEAVRRGLQALRPRVLLDAHGVQERHGVEQQISSISYLSQDLQVLRDFVPIAIFHGGIVQLGAQAYVFNEFSHPHDLSRKAELSFDGCPWLDGAGGVVGPIEIPGIESSKVLDGAQDLIAANWTEDVVSTRNPHRLEPSHLLSRQIGDNGPPQDDRLVRLRPLLQCENEDP